MKASLLRPAHPERVCWGCERLCPASDLVCGNGFERAQHPTELFGPDALLEAVEIDPQPLPSAPAAPQVLREICPPHR